MKTTEWGNPDQHNEAYRQALREFYERHPDAPRRFSELLRKDQTWILARQVELYQGLVHAHPREDSLKISPRVS